MIHCLLKRLTPTIGQERKVSYSEGKEFHPRQGNPLAEGPQHPLCLAVKAAQLQAYTIACIIVLFSNTFFWEPKFCWVGLYKPTGIFFFYLSLKGICLPPVSQNLAVSQLFIATAWPSCLDPKDVCVPCIISLCSSISPLFIHHQAEWALFSYFPAYILQPCSNFASRLPLGLISRQPF